MGSRWRILVSSFRGDLPAYSYLELNTIAFITICLILCLSFVFSRKVLVSWGWDRVRLILQEICEACLAGIWWTFILHRCLGPVLPIGNLHWEHRSALSVTSTYPKQDPLLASHTGVESYWAGNQKIWVEVPLVTYHTSTSKRFTGDPDVWF